MARRRPTAEELIEAHKHLIGLALHYDSGDGYWGEVKAVEADVANGVAVLIAEFPEAELHEVRVIRKRTPRALVGDSDVIWLKPGTQRGSYSWSAYVRDFAPPPEPEPVASFHVRLPAETWPRVAKKRKRALARSLGERLAEAGEAVLEGSLIDLPADERRRITTKVAASAASNCWFDIDILFEIYGVDHATSLELYERLAAYLDAAGEDPDRLIWVAPANTEFRQIRATSFTIDGAIEGNALPSLSGRLILR
jgi:hypothetical protein